MKRWHKQTAKQARSLSIARGATVPRPTGQPVVPLLPDAVRAFLTALEHAHASAATWLTALDDPQASEEARTRASLAIMIEANSLTDDIRDLAEATRADAVAVGAARRTRALTNIRRVVRQHV